MSFRCHAFVHCCKHFRNIKSLLSNASCSPVRLCAQLLNASSRRTNIKEKLVLFGWRGASTRRATRIEKTSPTSQAPFKNKNKRPEWRGAPGARQSQAARTILLCLPGNLMRNVGVWRVARPRRRGRAVCGKPSCCMCGNAA